MMDTTPYYIYLARLGDSNIHKVGYSSNLPLRLKSLETYARKTFDRGNMAFINQIECYTLFVAEVEYRLHQFYRKHKVSYTKEWFTLNERQVKLFPSTYNDIYKQVCADYPDEALAPRVYYWAECIDERLRKDILETRKEIARQECHPFISRDRRIRRANKQEFQRQMSKVLGGYFVDMYPHEY